MADGAFGVRVQEGQTRGGAPVAQQSGLDVIALQRPYPADLMTVRGPLFPPKKAE